ncbi:mono/diheme cytochrome c family protein [Gillisia sp. Hel_I_86]|uniref:c-type cytochrome n=1 Tax=Gillisia sp. Hel_I_86 TaxID=1249981 RepID=UPI00119AC4A2|nr:cytochrome c [Gillisia sp. Hel_I_86]TVZ25774.1 mono/diheme cytochrome c family protein [Gillisia sp. Hel_I_86]
MKSLFHKSIVLFLVVATATSCFNKEKPNYQYFPDMYEPVPYEAFGEYDIFVNGQEAKLPVEGTIPRGWTPYGFENSFDGYLQSKAQLTNPLPYSEKNIAAGQQLYTIYCAVCHGDQGDGKGILVEREKILGVPSYDDAGRAITEGSIYHVMYYGINSMGSYASQTTIEERWQIDHYVMKLKGTLEGKPERTFQSDTASVKKNLVPAVNADETILGADANAEQDQESTN